MYQGKPEDVYNGLRQVEGFNIQLLPYLSLKDIIFQSQENVSSTHYTGLDRKSRLAPVQPLSQYSSVINLQINIYHKILLRIGKKIIKTSNILICVSVWQFCA